MARPRLAAALIAAVLLASAPARGASPLSIGDPQRALATIGKLLGAGKGQEAQALVGRLLGSAEDLDLLEQAGRLVELQLLRARAALAVQDRAEVVRAFQHLLAVDPGWRPERTGGADLLPEALPIFGEVLADSGTRPPLWLRPSRGEGPDEVAVVLYDPKGAVSEVVLKARRQGVIEYQRTAFIQAVYGARHRLAKLPFLGAEPGKPYVLEYHVEGLSATGDVIVRLGTSDHPIRQERKGPMLPQGARPGKAGSDRRWYQNRWLWIAAGVVAVGAIVGGAIAATRGATGGPAAPPGLLLRF